MKWSIIDLAREHSKARKEEGSADSRRGIGHCRWQVALAGGGDRMWPTCAMRWCWARFGGAHRESSPSIPPLQLPAAGVAPGLWSKLWTRFERLAEIPK